LSKPGRIITFISELPIIEQILEWSKNYVSPGFDEVPIYNVVRFVIEEIGKDNITTRASAVAFNFFLSLFPLIIFLLPLLAQTSEAIKYLELFRESIKGVIPGNAENYIFETVQGIQDEGSITWLGLSFFLAIFFSSTGMDTLMTGFDKSYDATFKKRSYIRQRFIAVLLTLLLSTLVIASVVLIILGNQFLGNIFQWIGMDQSPTIIKVILRWVILLLLFYSVITVIYIYGPAMRTRIKFFSPGATLATALSIITSVGFSYFVNVFGRYNEIYGSIGALIVMLIWIQFNSFIMIIGFELNASIAVNRDLRALNKD